jgi:hypothetical protein
MATKATKATTPKRAPRPGLTASAPALPRARGPISHTVIQALRRPPHADHAFEALLPRGADPMGDDDLQLALYVCYELHYRGWAGVDPGWEWDPHLLALRQRMEAAFLGALHAAVEPSVATDPLRPADAVEALRRLVDASDGPSLSTYAAEQATLDQLREFAIHRSLYQLKEADPHTWAIPRLPPSRGKAALLRLQFDEYGEGLPGRSHAELFAETLRALDLDDRYGAYLDVVPAATLATVNLLSLLGLHRALVGACIGHLAVFEMTSVVPMGRYADAVRRLTGCDAGTEFYDVHVVADAEHQQVAIDQLVPGILETEPALADDVLFGARALMLLEGRLTEHLLGCWDAGRSSLQPRPAALDLAS